MGIGAKILSLLYLVIGVVVAAGHHYFTHVDTLNRVLSAILAIALWPLILLGVNLHVHPFST